MQVPEVVSELLRAGGDGSLALGHDLGHVAVAHPQLEAAGMVISARTPSEDLPEMMELPATMHPWFVGVQFHPEFTSNPRTGHPLFIAYVKAALAHKGVK